MNKIYFLAFLCITLTACNSSKNTLSKSSEITYNTYKNQQKTFNSKDGKIKYIDKGSGKVIVLLHGVPTSGWLYRNMIDELAKTHRVIVPDMLGFGNSDSPKGYDVYSEKNHAKRLLGLMNHLKIENWTHVMHDAGGLWTWELFSIAPDKIKNLVVLNTIIYEEGFTPPIRFEEGFWAKTAMWSYRNGFTTNMMLKKLFKSGMTENTLSKTGLEGYKTPLKEGKTKAMYYFFTQTCNVLQNYESIIKNINIPTTIIWGKNDDFLKLQPQQERIVKDLKVAPENIYLLDAKHFIQEENPTKITKIILKAAL